jgi:hypothetical protein
MLLFGCDKWGFFEFINSRSIHFYLEFQEYGMFLRIKFQVSEMSFRLYLSEQKFYISRLIWNLRLNMLESQTHAFCFNLNPVITFMYGLLKAITKE